MRTKWFVVISVVLALVLTGVPASAVPAQQDQQGKVTICHAAGREGTLHYEELTLAYSAVYGKAGHFLEPGTPNAGHEHDIEGPCPKAPTPTPIPPTETPTEVPPTATPIPPTETPEEPTPTPTETPEVTETPEEPTPTPTATVPVECEVLTQACCHAIEVQIVIHIYNERNLETIGAVFDYLDERGYACCASVRRNGESP